MLPMPDPTVPAVGVHQAEQMLANGAILIDVREKEEWAAARIPGARLLPMSEVNRWHAELARDRDVILH